MPIQAGPDQARQQGAPLRFGMHLTPSPQHGDPPTPAFQTQRAVGPPADDGSRQQDRQAHDQARPQAIGEHPAGLQQAQRGPGQGRLKRGVKAFKHGQHPGHDPCDHGHRQAQHRQGIGQCRAHLPRQLRLTVDVRHPQSHLLGPGAAGLTRFGQGQRGPCQPTPVRERQRQALPRSHAFNQALRARLLCAVSTTLVPHVQRLQPRQPGPLHANQVPQERQGLGTCLNHAWPPRPRPAWCGPRAP